MPVSADPIGATNTCDAGAGKLAYPITSKIYGPGGSWFQLFQVQPVEPVVLGGWQSDVYASWSLAPGAIIVGPDAYGIGFEMDGLLADIARGIGYQSATCYHLGAAMAGATVEVNAGTVGSAGADSCTVEFHWDVTVGLEYSIWDGPTFKGEMTLGGSIACTSSTTYDSELLFKYIGPTGLCTPCMAEGSVPISSGCTAADAISTQVVGLDGSTLQLFRSDASELYASWNVAAPAAGTMSPVIAWKIGDAGTAILARASAACEKLADDVEADAVSVQLASQAVRSQSAGCSAAPWVGTRAGTAAMSTATGPALANGCVGPGGTSTIYVKPLLAWRGVA
ncbi:MAG: hypothetical protein QOD77_558 [Thermoplasmata archaeon]|jgi:hypothetical protein|nr:hypothetical protein [Thermoplasmata archaeon]